MTPGEAKFRKVDFVHGFSNWHGYLRDTGNDRMYVRIICTKSKSITHLPRARLKVVLEDRSDVGPDSEHLVLLASCALIYIISVHS